MFSNTTKHYATILKKYYTVYGNGKAKLDVGKVVNDEHFRNTIDRLRQLKINSHK